MTHLEHLFRPLKIGRMEVKNRLVMSCMAGGFAVDRNGYPIERMIAYYVERAKSRPGMMGIGAGSVVPPIPDPRDVNRPKYSVVLYEDGCIAPMRKFTDAIHEHDTKFGIQIWDGGIQSGGRVQLTPSGIGMSAAAVGDLSEERVLKILTVEEIATVVKQFAEAAERCAKAGFDFVEIHAGHGYLISSFLSPHFNRRTDQYGGSFENRTRFVREILRAVKARVGNVMTVGIKINGDDYLPNGGWTLKESTQLAPLLEKDGADYLSMTAGVMGSPRLTVPPMYEPQACYLEGGEEVRKYVSIPVGVVGRIKNPVMADELIRDGKVDLVSFGRPMIADPELPEKARNGNLEDIRPCLADCRGCLEHQTRSIKRGEVPQTSCIVNPRVFRELECVDIPNNKKDSPKTILVVGAGCSGLEAARRAAFSGHRVILCEKRDAIGGQIRLAERIPGRHEIGDIVPWYGRQLKKLGVEVRLNTVVDERLLAQLKPDIVVIATGSLPSVPEGLTTSLYNAESIDIVMADDLLEEKPEIGNNVLVLGGEQIGLQIADYVSEQGKKVVVAEESGHFASKLAANDRWYLTSRILKKGVARIKNVREVEIAAGDKVSLVTDKGRQELPGIDTIILASERKSDRGLVEIAERLGLKTHVVGDASDVTSEDGATIFSSIAQGYDVARHL